MVTAAVADDASYAGESGTATTTLDRRTSGTTYVGSTRAQPGSTTTLKARLVDRTPGSSRNGRPIADEPVALRLADDAGTKTTGADGTAARGVPVTGESRTETAAVTYGGSTVWTPSADSVTFYVGDAAATTAPVEHGLVGGITRTLGGLLQDLGTFLAGPTGRRRSATCRSTSSSRRSAACWARSAMVPASPVTRSTRPWTPSSTVLRMTLRWPRSWTPRASRGAVSTSISPARPGPRSSVRRSPSPSPST